MNTEEAIYFLEHEVKLFPHEAKSLPACLKIYKIAENIEEIIKLLKRGEKFEEMWGELEMYVEGMSEALTHKMDILWQKYIIEKEVAND